MLDQTEQGILRQVVYKSSSHLKMPSLEKNVVLPFIQESLRPKAGG